MAWVSNKFHLTADKTKELVIDPRRQVSTDTVFCEETEENFACQPRFSVTSTDALSKESTGLQDYETG